MSASFFASSGGETENLLFNYEMKVEPSNKQQKLESTSSVVPFTCASNPNVGQSMEASTNPNLMQQIATSHPQQIDSPMQALISSDPYSMQVEAPQVHSMHRRTGSGSFSNGMWLGCFLSFQFFSHFTSGPIDQQSIHRTASGGVYYPPVGMFFIKSYLHTFF